MTTHLTTSSDTTTGAPRRTRGDWTRKYAAASGAFYLVTFLSSVPALFLIAPVLDDTRYVLGSGSDGQVVLGCLFDMVNALTAVGSAVAVFPVMRRVNEALALGFVTSRLMEAAIIMVGVAGLLAVVTLRQDVAAGGDPAGMVGISQALVAVRDWTFLLGPGVMVAFNALLFGTLLYRSRLVPRVIPTLGLIGAPLLLSASLATAFGHNEQLSLWSAIGTLPIAAWELSVGIYMLTRGFRPAAVAALPEA